MGYDTIVFHFYWYCKVHLWTTLLAHTHVTTTAVIYVTRNSEYRKVTVSLIRRMCVWRSSVADVPRTDTAQGTQHCLAAISENKDIIYVLPHTIPSSSTPTDLPNMTVLTNMSAMKNGWRLGNKGITVTFTVDKHPWHCVLYDIQSILQRWITTKFIPAL